MPTAQTDSPKCVGDNLNLTAAGASGPVFHWSGPAGFSATGATQTINLTSTNQGGVYSVIAVANGCTSDLATVSVTVNSPATVPTLISNSPVCQGKDLVLTVEGIANAEFIWSGPNNFAQTTTSPTLTRPAMQVANAGQYSVVAVTAGCTSQTGVANVVVNSLPPTPVASNDGPYCVGEDLVLNAQSSVTDPNATFLWLGYDYIANGPINVTQYTKPNLTLAETGIYSLAVISQGCTSAFATTNVQVFSIPAPPTIDALHSNPICVGKTLTVSAVFLTDAQYIWSGPNNFAATNSTPVNSIQIPNVTTANAGIYTLITVVNGCTASAATTFEIVVQDLFPAPTVSSDSPKCINQTLSLTVAAAPGFIYHWSGPNGFAATGAGPTFTRSNLTTADAGVYSVIGIQNGCSTQTATIPVTVNDAIPPAPTVTTNSPLCVGQDLQIRVIGTGTFNLTGPGGYSASGPGPIFTRPNASLGFNGTYSVTTTVDGCTSLAATTLVTVNSPPVANPSSNSPRCVGQTLFLNAASTVPGSSFEWSGPNGYTSPNQNAQILNATTAASGIYTLTVSAPGCPAATATVSVTVIDVPPPTVATNSPVCAGSTLILSSGSSLSGVTYVWSGPSGYSATTSANEVSRANVNSSAAGIYSVVAILGGCTSPVAVTEPVVIRFVPQPIAQFVNTSGTAPTSVCQGGSFRITVTNTSAFEPGTTFIWQGPQGSMAHSADTYEVSAAQLSHAGVYRIWAVANGCTSIASLPVTVTVIPAPSTPSVTNNGPICEDAGEATLRVSPIAGVAQYQWSGPGGFSATGLQVRIPANLANAGVYSVTAFTAEGCSSAVGVTTLVITPKPALPVIYSNSPVCQGQALHLTIEGPAGANYTLRGPNGYAVSGVQTEYSRLNMNASFAGLYSLTATVSGCITPEVTHKVNVLSSPPRPLASNNGPRCEGERLVLTASGGGAGATYRWSGPEGFTALGATAILSNISSSQAGVYSVVAIAEGCTSAPSLTTVEVTPLPNITLVSNSPVCQGSSLIITVNNAPSGAYFEMRGPNRYFAAGNYVVFNRPNIQPEDSGVYTLTVSVGACRGISSTINIAVKPVPVLERLFNNGPLCQGQELQLTAIGAALESYIWRFPNNATLVTSSPTHIIPAATLANGGVYHVSGVINGCATNAVSTVVAIQAAPAAPSAANDGPICIMSNATLQAQGIRGATYLWSGPDGFVSTEQTFTRQITDPSMAGIYTVVAIANGCTSEPATTILEVIDLNLSPEVSGPQSLCVGANLQLTSSGLPSGVSYRWEGPAAFSSDEPNPVINDVQTFNSGVYYLLAFGQGCTSRVAEVEVTIRPQPPMPLANFTGNLCEGGAIRLSATIIPDAQYYWQGPAGFESFEQNPALRGITPMQSGTYSVIAYIGNCSSEAGTVNITIRSAPNPPVASNDGPYCAGQNINLVASSISGATYLWSGPGGFTSTQRNATRPTSKLSDAGIYSVVAIVNGCTSSPATTLVQVRPSQAPLSASSNSPVCQGQPVYLTTPFVAGASYLWSGPLGFSSTDREPVIPNPTPAQAGVYAVRLIIDACTSSAISTNVFVQPKPQNIAISSNGPICAGQTLLLTATSVPGAVYQWSGPSGFSASQSNVIINNATVGASGVYRLRVSVGNCVAPLDSVTVVVHPAAPPAPRVSSNSPLCQGQAIQLFASAPSAATFNWTGPYGFSSTLQNPSIPNALPEFSGVYTLTVSNGPCSAPPVTVNVSVTPTPSVSISANSPLCEGGSLELSAAPISGARYQWSGPNNFTSTQLVNTLAPATTRMSGVYTLEVALGSCVSRVTRQIQVSPVPVAGPITSNSPVCAGGILTLSAPQVLGASYEWKGPNGFVSTLQNLAPIAPVTSQNAGIYSLITILNGCTSAVATHEVRVIGITTMPDIVSNAPVCEGDLLQLSATLLPGVVYQWQGPNNFSASIANPIRSAMRLSDAGIYTLNVTTASCRTPISLTVEVGVKPLPPAPIASSNSPICNDGALQLSANSPSATQFYWTGPNGFTSAQQNPTVATPTSAHSGTYHVQAIAEGCTSAATAVRVSVAQAPQTPRISASQSAVCEGSRLLLTASVGDGSSILWNGPSGFSSTASMVTLAPVTAGQGGTYSAVAILGACTSSVVTQNISVIPFASVIEAGSNSPVCQGASLELTASAVAGAFYTWRGPLGFESSLQNPIITSALPTQSGVYTLEVRVGSCTQVIEVPVTVRAAQGEISATASTPICEGQPLRLAANELPGATYVWSGPLGFSATGPVVQREGLTSLNSGAYVLNASINGCSIAEITLNVEILPGPGSVVAQNNGPLCAGNTLALSANANPGAIYYWNGPAGFTSTLANPVIPNVEASRSGVYTVTVSMPNCPLRVTATTEVRIDPPLLVRRIWNSGPICAGQELALGAEAIAGASYNWSGPNGFTSTLQQPVIPNAGVSQGGIYSLTITRGACTLSNLTTSVEIRPRPLSPTIEGNRIVCEGNALALTAMGSSTTYIWNGPNNYSATAPSISIAKTSSFSAGIYSVIAVQNGCSSETATVEVQVTRVNASFAESEVSVCSGDPATLTVIASGTAPWSVTYTDGVQNNTIYFNQSPFQWSVFPSVATTYTLLTVEDANGCRASIRSSATVNPNPKPEARFTQAGGSACAGSLVNIPLELKGKGPWQITYMLDGVLQPSIVAGANASPSPFLFNLSFPALQSGVVTLAEVRDATGCRSTYNQNYALTVSPCADPCPAPTNLTITNVSAVGARINWQPSSSGAVCYIVSYGLAGTDPATWQMRLVPHPGNSLELTGLAPGLNYAVRVQSNCNLCSSRSGTMSTLPATGGFTTYAAKAALVSSSRIWNIALYPNPTTGQLAITLQSSLSEGNLIIDLFDATGRAISSTPFIYSQGSQIMSLDLTAQPSGVYFLQIRDLNEGLIQTVKVIKQ
jgi:hypothetical protein